MLNNIKFGIKISINNFDILPDIYNNRHLIDFIEILINPDYKIEDIEIIKKLKIPYAIHFPNSNNGIDLGDIKKNKKNIEFIKKINQDIKILNQLNPICYIIHPESGDIDLSIKNLKIIKIKPIAIENMPVKSIYGGNLLGYDPNSLKTYFNEIQGLKFCFDINHAIKAAISKNINYIVFIKEFLKFKRPDLFHISGGNLDIEIDEHLSLDKGKYNLFEIKKVLLNYNSIINLTFETPRNYERRIQDDLNNIKIFLKS